MNHDWIGRIAGRPHPRKSWDEIKETLVTEDEDAFEPLTKRDIPEFGKSTADLLLHIVNNCGVLWRAIDGGHIMLFPPDGASRPFKVAAKRSAQENNRILRRQFMDAFGLPSPEEFKRAQREEKRAAHEAAMKAEEQEMAKVTVEPEPEGVPEELRSAFERLSHYLGIQMIDPVREDELEEEIADLNRQVTALVDQVKTVTAERDDCRAKLSLLRETLAGLED